MRSSVWSMLLLTLLFSVLLTSAYRRDEVGRTVELNEDNWRVVLKGEWMILL